MEELNNELMNNLFLSSGFTFSVLALTVIILVSNWKIYAKAGEPGWASIIPIYNYIVLLRIVGKPLWWVILLIIPGINLIISIWVTNLLSKSFGKGVGFTLGLIFLGFIFFPILGFGNAKYIGPVGDPERMKEFESANHEFGQ
jgi:hypothetical protein